MGCYTDDIKLDRQLTAYRMRSLGKTYPEIGKVLSVGASYARSLSQAGERRARALVQTLPAAITVFEATPDQLALAGARLRIRHLEQENQRLHRDLGRLDQ